MKKTLGKFIRKTVAGISALAITASSYAAANALTYVKLPVANAADEKSPLIGDVNEDNKIDINDIITLSRYFYNSAAYPLSQQGRINAAMAYYAGSDDTPDEDDLQAITEYLGGNIPVLGDSSIRLSTDLYENVPGDADCDGDVDFSDLKAINNYLFNPSAYPLTDQGRRNAAMSYYAGNDNTPDEDDVQAVIEYLSGNISKLCDSDVRLTDCAPEDFPGDADCDGDVDFSDLKAINNYLFNPTAYPLTDQGRRNAAMSYYAGNDNTPDEDDVQALIEYFAGNISKLCDSDVRLTDCAPEDFPGDADCDGDVDFSDLKAINNYLFNPTAYPLTDQGRCNAAMSYYAGNDNAPDEDDVQALIEYLAGNISKLCDQNVRLTDCAAKPVPGDADCDGDVDYEDIFKLRNYLYNPTAYPMTDQGRRNAAMSYYAGNDNAPDEEDLQAMVEYLAGTVDSLYDTSAVLKLSFRNISFDNSGIVYGDFNCDGEVDIVDSADIYNFINGGTVSEGEAKSEADFYQNVKISVSGLRNADAYNPGFGLDTDDADAVTAHLSGAELPVVKKTFENKPGDFNCDNTVDISDAVILNRYISGAPNYIPSAQGRKNADVFTATDGTTIEDVAAIAEFIAGINDLPTEKIVKDGSVTVYGDFNCDGKVNTSDAVMLNRYISGAPNYIHSAQGRKNADVFTATEGATIEDVAAIAEFIAGINDLPTEKIVKDGTVTVFGDFNCDGKVNIADVVMLNRYISGAPSYTPSAQGIKNADVFTATEGTSIEDVAAIAEFIAGINDIPAEKLVNNGSKTLDGDFNCDNKFNISDAVMLCEYLTNTNMVTSGKYTASAQGLINADVVDRGSSLNFEDLAYMLNTLRGGEPSQPETTTTSTSTTTSTTSTTTSSTTTTASSTSTTTSSTTTTTSSTTTTTSTTSTTTSSTSTTTSSTTTTTSSTTAPVTTPSVKLGDITGDGNVNATDAALILYYYAYCAINGKASLSPEMTAAGDVDGNGIVDATDASYILTYYAYKQITKDTVKTFEEFMKSFG